MREPSGRRLCPRHLDSPVFWDLLSDTETCQRCLKGEAADPPRPSSGDRPDPTNLLTQPKKVWGRRPVDPNFRRNS